MWGADGGDIHGADGAPTIGVTRLGNMRQERLAAADEFAQEFAVKLLDGMLALLITWGLIAKLRTHVTQVGA